jgi:hypothetical protein
MSKKHFLPFAVRERSKGSVPWPLLRKLQAFFLDRHCPRARIRIADESNQSVPTGALWFLKGRGMKRFFLLLGLGMLIVDIVSVATAASILNSGVWSETMHAYRVLDFPGETWDSAFEDLRLQPGYHLATITGAEEQAFIETLLQGMPGEYWLGGKQDPLDTLVAAENWTWVTGEPWAYTNWLGGEPNDYSGPGSEQHLGLRTVNSQWGWNDEGYPDNITGYIAESTLPVPVPATVLLFGSGLIALVALRKSL